MQTTKKTKLTPSQLRMKKMLMPLVEQIISEYDDEDKPPPDWDQTSGATVKRELIPFLTAFSKKTGIVVYGAELYDGDLDYCRYYLKPATHDNPYMELRTDFEYNQ